MEQEAKVQKQRIAQQDELARSYRNTSSELETMVITGADIMNIAVIFGLEVPESTRSTLNVRDYILHIDAAPFRRITKNKLEAFGRDQIDLMEDILPKIKKQNHEI